MCTPRPLGACAFSVLLVAGLHHLVRAAEHTGEVTFAGAPVPGVTVTASRGDRRMTTTTNGEGGYRFADLDDGPWTIRVEILGFSPVTRQVTIASDAAAGERWELSMLSLDEITSAGTESARRPPAEAQRDVGRAAATTSRPQTAAASDTALPPRAPVPSPAPPQTGPATTAPPQSQPAATTQAATPAAPLADEPPSNPLFGAGDSFLVNGSVMNASASPFAQSRALGNFRFVQTRSPYAFSGSIGGRSAAFDARPVGVAQRPSNHNLNFSGTVGGPVRIPRLIRDGPQFTLTFSRSDSYDARSSSLLLPTTLERAGDFSQSIDGLGRPVQIVDPRTGRPFDRNTIPADRLSPEARALVGYYPPAGDSQDRRANYQAAAIADAHTDSTSFRLGAFSIGTRTQIDNVTIGYSRGVNDTTTPFLFEDKSRTSGIRAGIGAIRRLNPYLLLRVRHQVNRETSRTEPYFANRLNVSGLAGIAGNNQDPANWGPPALTFRALAPLSTADHSLSRRLANLTVAEAAWSRRRQVITFGGEIERRHVNLVSQQNPRGSFFFSGDLTGVDFADFLLGLPQSSTIAFGNADKDFRQSVYAAFISDDLRISPSFTLNLGARWEYEAPVTERQGRLVNLDVAPGFSEVGPVVASGSAGRQYPSSLVRPDRGGIQPRVALAWRPILGSSIIVRAGYGIYRNTNVYESIALRLAQQPPLSFAASAVRSDETPITLANGFIASPGITQIPWAVDPHFKVGYAHNWQVMIQRDFPGAVQLAATYVGVKGSRLPQILLPNTYAPGAENPCPSCPTGFQYLTSGGRSDAHRAQFQVRRRLRNGFEASGQYTLATGADNAAAFTGISGTPVQNWLDLDAELGPSGLIRRHELGGEVRYTSTVETGRRGMRSRLLGGWLLSSQFSAGSGYPLTPVYATTVPGTTVTGAVRPQLTGEPLGAVPAGHYLNPEAFAAPRQGEWGNAGRGSVRGPGSFFLSATVSRSFRVHGRANVTWQMTATNLLNQVTRTGVNTFVGSPQFGLPIGFAPARRLNMQLQVTFR